MMPARLFRRAATSRWYGTKLSSEQLVRLERPGDGKVAVITLNDPKRLNALNASMGDQFVDTVTSLCESAETENLAAVVLTGEGRAFSAGGDLELLQARGADTPSRNAVIMRRFYERFLSVRRLPVPVVAAINGPAIGAGLALALACDVRVAAADAKMGITFVQLGLHPGMGSTHFLPQIVGPQIAAKMMLTGEVIGGAEALRIGMVAECCEDASATVDSAMKLVQQMASAAPLAVRATARSLRMSQDEGLDRRLWREADAQAQVWNSADLSDGVKALIEKRRPDFSNYESLVE